VDQSHRILAFVDGSDYTESVLAHASWLNEVSGGDGVDVVYVSELAHYQVSCVHELGLGVGVQPVQGWVSQQKQCDDLRIASISDRVRRFFSGSAIEDRYCWKVITGDPVGVVEDIENRYSQVVIGKRGEGFAVDPDRLGSHLSRFLKSVRIPCLLASRSFHSIRMVSLLIKEGYDWEATLIALLRLNPLPRKIEVLVAGGTILPQEARDRLDTLSVEGCAWNEVMLHGKLETEVPARVRDSGSNLLCMGVFKGTTLLQWLHSPVILPIVNSSPVPVYVAKT
jgi:nucleotide-binding universal stress UspA family protein